MNQELRDAIRRITGSNLRRIREEAKDSISDTSRKTKYSSVAISNYELGKRTLDVTYLIVFCKTYNVNYVDVLDTVIETQHELKKANYEQMI